MSEPMIADGPQPEREPLKAPEMGLAAASAALAPANTSLAPAKEVVPSPSLILTEAEREAAEAQLVNYLAPKLVASLHKQGEHDARILTLFDNTHFGVIGQAHDGRTDVCVTISGPNIGANEALVGNLLTDALKEHPAASLLFKGEVPPYLQTTEGAVPPQMELVFPQLETAAYTALIRAFALVKDTPKQETIDAATIANSKVAVHKDDAAVQAATATSVPPQNPTPSPVKLETPNDPTVQDNKPSTVVANVNSREPLIKPELKAATAR